MIADAEAQFEAEYTPLTSLLTRLYVSIGTLVLLAAVYFGLSMAAKKQGGWGNLCCKCLDKTMAKRAPEDPKPVQSDSKFEKAKSFLRVRFTSQSVAK